jgi:signal transduction histidine kinase
MIMINSLKSPEVFPAILASTVHDIKNSLGVLLELIRQMAVRQQPGEAENFSQLEFEANRINHSLMQLLVVYKIGASKFGLDIDEYAALDLIYEAKAQQDVMSKLKHVQVQVAGDADLLCYCDFAHISNALGTILNNALRYTHSAISLSVDKTDDGFVRFCIEDDGQGYPEHLLQADLRGFTNLDWVRGNAGLGLFFVSVVAGLHENGDKAGFVCIDNASRLGGARFCLFLP